VVLDNKVALLIFMYGQVENNVHPLRSVCILCQIRAKCSSPKVRMHLMPDQSKVVEERGGGLTEKAYTVHI